MLYDLKVNWLPLIVVSISHFQNYDLSIEFIMCFGMVDAGRESFMYNLNQGTSVMVVVGGAREALLSKPGELRLTLKRRKGFVVQALKAGANLVPVFSFGETNLYTTYILEEGSFLHRFQIKFMSLFGFSTPIFTGRGIFNYSFGLLPHRHPCHTVVGSPIELPKIEDPKPEEIDKWHGIYIEALTKLYNDHNPKYGNIQDKLVIAE
jgi:2-acylglycerol O-acyltransferase 2